MARRVTGEALGVRDGVQTVDLVYRQRVQMVSLVCLVYLVCLAFRPEKRDRPNEPGKQAERRDGLFLRTS